MTEIKTAITVGLNPSTTLFEEAKQWSQQLQVPLLKRTHGDSLDILLAEHNLEALIIITRQGIQIYSAAGLLRFHPGMAELRIRELLRGGKDNFVEALKLKQGMKILDCTLGLGADAIVASHIVGASGMVVGLEAILPIWLLTSHGFKTYESKTAEINMAMRTITTLHDNAANYLLNAPKDSFDVVYFDPMFKQPVQTSSNFTPMRKIACHDELTLAMIEKALQVAPLVVVKERDADFFNNLLITEIKGGKYSRVKYGIRRR
ncbi:MAG TPA: class I SAM-dependent methyltransferase [Candidatus Avacidaminococcus intestinavium]|uniref:Class I SAM-dependent methyltransferase n=1 Tax=Candidatus Avacidaminococcus intestinavium TaxID=2840684 RepID=A0A9D1SLI2_9FIRM|nr:class I SAM-dependent methyltransferase [Candidatus Avacidaminococcus intestinavium]